MWDRAVPVIVRYALVGPKKLDVSAFPALRDPERRLVAALSRFADGGVNASPELV